MSDTKTYPVDLITHSLLSVFSAVCFAIVGGCAWGASGVEVRQFSKDGVMVFASNSGRRAGRAEGRQEMRYRLLRIEGGKFEEPPVRDLSILVSRGNIVRFEDMSLDVLKEHGVWYQNQGGDKHNPRWEKVDPANVDYAKGKCNVRVNRGMYRFVVKDGAIAAFITGTSPYYLSETAPSLIKLPGGGEYQFPLTPSEVRKIFGEPDTIEDGMQFGPL